MGQIQDSSF